MLVTVYLERSKTTDERGFPARLFCINIASGGGEGECIHIWNFLYIQHNLHIHHIYYRSLTSNERHIIEGKRYIVKI